MTTSTYQDNRNQDEMIVYYEARIEALSKRVRELEEEKARRDRTQNAMRISAELRDLLKERRICEHGTC